MFKPSCSVIDVVLISLWLTCLTAFMGGSQASQPNAAQPSSSGTNYYCNCNGLGSAEIVNHLSQMKKELAEKLNELKKRVAACESNAKELKQVAQMQRQCTQGKVLRNCAELYRSGCTESGVYTINPDGQGTFDVFCDQTTDGGGWTVLQRRRDGSVNFYRDWNTYKTGFGNLYKEHWLGLDNIHRLTQVQTNKLRVDLVDWGQKSAYAEYSSFAVSGESLKYRLSQLGSYSGNAGDSLTIHREKAFTTKDSDNDDWAGNNCATHFKGAWWYSHCYNSNLNGQYYVGGRLGKDGGVDWSRWKGNHYSAKYADMKIRPTSF